MSDIMVPDGYQLMFFDGTTDHEVKSRLTGSQKIPRRFFVRRKVSDGIWEIYAVPVISAGVVFGEVVGLQSLTTFPVGSTVRRGSKQATLPVSIGREATLDFVPDRLHTSKTLLLENAVFDLFYTSEVS